MGIINEAGGSADAQRKRGSVWIFKSQVNQPEIEAALAKKNTEQVFNQHRRCSTNRKILEIKGPNCCILHINVVIL